MTEEGEGPKISQEGPDLAEVARNAGPQPLPTLKDAADMAAIDKSLESQGVDEQIKTLKRELVQAKSELEGAKAIRQQLDTDLEYTRDALKRAKEESDRMRFLRMDLADRLNRESLRVKELQKRPDPEALEREVKALRAETGALAKTIAYRDKTILQASEAALATRQQARAQEHQIRMLESSTAQMQAARNTAQAERNAAVAREAMAVQDKEAAQAKLAQREAAIDRLLAALKVCEELIQAPADASVWTLINDAKAEAQP